MSTSKHFDKLCIAVVALLLVLSLLLACGATLGISSAPRAVGYESRLFTTTAVHTIDLVMNDWDSFLATCENEEYAPCTAVIDGEKFSNIAIRAKGNTSLSSVKSMGSQRYSFKLEFDQYDQSKSYYGLDKLCLNNLIQDNTMMKDYLVYRMMADFGADAPLCSFVYITVNGEDWGLYLAVEGIEDAFLTRNYGNDPGELYKPDSTGLGGGRGNGKDFNMDKLELDTQQSAQPAQPNNQPPQPDGQQGNTFPQRPDRNDFQGGQPPQPPAQDNQQPQLPTQDAQQPQLPTQDAQPNQRPGGMGGMGGGMGSDDVKLKYIDDDPDSYTNIFSNAKTDLTSADKARLISALKNLSDYTNLDSTLDINEVLRYFVVHNFVCNGDSYTGSIIHNYYLHEQDGRLSMIPWDYNLAFGTFQGGNASSAVNAAIDSPVSGGSVDDRPMVGWIFSDESYTAQYHELFRAFLEHWFADGALVREITQTAELLRPYVAKDPTKFCTEEDFTSGVDTLTQFVTLRGEAVQRQLDGDTTPVDTDTLNLSAMGNMGGNRGGNQPGDQSGNQPGDPTQNTRPSFGGIKGNGNMNFDRGQGNPAPGTSDSPAPSGQPQPASSGQVWVLTVLSLAVLAAGLLVAWRKKN